MAYIGRVLLNQDAVAKALEEKGVKLVAAQKRALEAGGEIVRQRMIASARTAFVSRSGKLIGGIRKKVSASARAHGDGIHGSVKIGVWTDDVMYAYFVEKGHAPPYRAKKIRSDRSKKYVLGRGKGSRKSQWAERDRRLARGYNGGRTPPHPYIEPAVEQSIAEAERVIAETIRQEAGL